MLALALLAASSLFMGAQAQDQYTIKGELYIEAECRGEALGGIEDPQQCYSAINSASIEVTYISQYCELRGYTDSGCSQGQTTIIALQGYTGCFTFDTSDVSYVETFCTMSDGPLQNRTINDEVASPTQLAVREAGTVGMLQKRWIISLALAVFKVSNYAFAALGIYSSCTATGGSDINLSACIWGVLSTLVTAGMDLNNLYGNAKDKLSIYSSQVVMGWAGIPSGGSSSTVEHAAVEAYSHNITQAMQAGSAMNYTHHGYLYANNTKHGHLVPAGASKWPVMEVTNPHGAKYHHLMVPYKTGILHRMGPAPQLSARQSYNGEYFTAGAMDSYACLNSGDYHDQLGQQDFEQVYDLVSCGVPDTQGTSDVEYQILDDTIQGTLGSGSIAGVNPNGQTRITDDSDCPSGLAATSCGTQSVDRRRR